MHIQEITTFFELQAPYAVLVYVFSLLVSLCTALAPAWAQTLLLLPAIGALWMMLTFLSRRAVSKAATASTGRSETAMLSGRHTILLHIREHKRNGFAMNLMDRVNVGKSRRTHLGCSERDVLVHEAGSA